MSLVPLGRNLPAYHASLLANGKYVSYRALQNMSLVYPFTRFRAGSLKNLIEQQPFLSLIAYMVNNFGIITI